ncbi:MAG: 50S ribosomal protein L30 [Chloroflexi bacterium]|nr:50S ribosomal protein L30 [Chloroflexota bacterium]
MAGKLRITLHKSTVSTTREARGTIRALGLRRIGQAVEHADTPATRGMIRAVSHLVTGEAVSDSAARNSRTRSASTSRAASATSRAASSKAASSKAASASAASRKQDQEKGS